MSVPVLLALIATGCSLFRTRIPQAGCTMREGLTESRFFEVFAPVWHRQAAQKLQEVRPGLFFTASGTALDFRGESPTWRSYRLTKR